MLKKLISYILTAVMMMSSAPYSDISENNIPNVTAETTAETTTETEQPSYSEDDEVIDSDYDQEENSDYDQGDNSENELDTDNDESEDSSEIQEPKCYFSFGSSLARSADDNIVKSNSDTPDINITRFDVSVRYGAEKNKAGDYVWTPNDSDSGHHFIFRINYALSGTYDYNENEIQFSVPASILLNRNKEKSDEYNMSVPHKDADGLTDSNVFVYDEKTDENGEKYLVIYNRIPVSAAQSGFIEVEYLTSESTYEYADYNPDYAKNGLSKNESKPFYANLEIQQNDVKKSESSNEIPVCIDTSAKIKSTYKTISYTSSQSELYSEWNASWGEKPADADDYYYLIWQIRSIITNSTQPYDFSLVDSFKNDGDVGVVGYKMQGQSTYTSAEDGGGVVKNLKEDFKWGRYDYVLTRHSQKDYKPKTKYTLKNTVTANVKPTDKIDEVSSKTSGTSWYFEQPEFHPPVGHFYAYKYGLDYKNGISENSSASPRRFDLDNYHSETNDVTGVIDNLAYYTYVHGYPYPWTIADGESADDPESYGKKNVTFELCDETLNLKALEKSYSDKLTKDDYQFDKINIFWKMLDADYNYESYEFKSKEATYTSDDKITVYAKFNDGDEWVEIGCYNIFNPDLSYLTDDAKDTYGVKVEGTTFSFSNKDYICTGYRLLTSNKHYYTRLGAYPYVTLKMSKTVTDTINEAYECNNYEIALKNSATYTTYASDTVDKENMIYSGIKEGVEYVVGGKRQGYINKKVEGYSNNKVLRNYTITWSAEANESCVVDNAVRKYVQQTSGRFYDLLPAGAVYKEGSLSAYADNVKLSIGQYSVNTILNYKGSGRTLLVVDYDVSANKNYSFKYSTNHSWESIMDYGTIAVNSIAYETGNDDIGDGRPDDGGEINDKEIMSGLDPESSGKKFLYAQKDHEMLLVVQASSGLDKKVMANGDNGYSYSTYTYSNSQYSYNYRYVTDDETKSKDIILFDSLENYKTPGGKTSDWHGIFEDIDLSHLKSIGASPVVYCYCKDEALDIEDKNNRDLSNEEIWTPLDQITDRSKVKAIAIDLRKDADGNDFVLPADSSLSVKVYMRSPKGIESKSTDPVAYNNLYRYATDVSILDGSSSSSLIHHDFTELRYRVSADLCLHKRDSTNTDKPIEGIKFRLWGTSYYGTKVDITGVTSSKGDINFDNIERGEYSLQEVDGIDDYQIDHTLMTVSIDEEGNVVLKRDGSVVSSDNDSVVSQNNDGSYTILNPPRVHADFEFVKKRTVDGSKNLRYLEGAVFKLSGKSAYGNMIEKTATSDGSGKVLFENIEEGTYTLTEVKPADGYIKPKTEYTVTLDSNGMLSFKCKDGSSVPYDDYGDYYIVNEPLHSFKIFKEDSVIKNYGLAGAEFKLYGTSDYGNYQEKKETSNDKGVASFTDLESGNYILKEIKAPSGHVLDDTPRDVTIKSDGSVTIDGLTFDEEFEWFAFDNERLLEGSLTVKKVWEDDENNSDRPIPVFHLDSKQPVRTLPVVTIDRSKWNNFVNNYQISSSPLRSAVSFTQNIDLTLEEVLAKADKNEAKRIDDGSTDCSVYFWKDDSNNAYWWTDAEIVYTPVNCSNMFRGCGHLTKIEIDTWNTKKTKNMDSMFRECGYLTSLDVSNFDTSNVTNMSNMFDYCYSLTNLNVSNFDTSKVTNMRYMFYYCKALINLDVSSFNTSKVTDMSYMFIYCFKLTNLDVRNFNTSNVTNMSNMFCSCYALTTLDVSIFNTSKVTDMSNMFYECYKLTNLDVSNFNTSNVTNMSNMFYSCYALTNLDVSSFDTSNVTNMNSMFNGCSALINLDVSSFNTSNVTNMSNMFCSCYALTNLDVSSFDTSNVTDMNSMFYSCFALTNLDVSSFDTSNVTDMSYMFSSCSSLTNLDVSNFNTSNVTDMSYMFVYCMDLKTIYAGDKWNTDNVKKSESMFTGCRNLKGGKGTVYNSSYVDKTYARIDGGTSNPGYFTEKQSNTSTASAGNLSSSVAQSLGLISNAQTNYFPSVFAEKLSLHTESEESTTVSSKDAETEPSDKSLISYFKEYSQKAFNFITKTYSIVSSVVTDVLSETSDDNETPEPTVDVNYTSKSVMYDPKVDGEDTNNVYEKWIPLDDGNTWIYRFRVYDEDAEYYLWESELPGYICKNNVGSPSKPIKVTYQKGKNNVCNEPIVNIKEATTSLTVSKTLAGNSLTEEDRNTEFRFEISLSDKTLTDFYGDVMFINGKAQISLKGGESITASKLPKDISYEVIELDADKNGFTTSSVGADGTLEEGKGAVASFTNTKDKAGGLKISKTVKAADDDVELTETDLQKKFMFTVTLYDNNDSINKDINGRYGEVIFNSGTAQIMLSSGESAEITDLPIGLKYKVVEGSGNADDYYGYTSESSGGDGEIDSSVKEVKFTNVKHSVETNGFTLTKEVFGISPSEPFTFYVDFSGLEPASVYKYSFNSSDSGEEFTSDNYGNASISVKLSPKDSIRFDGLPIGSKYCITEPETDYIASYNVTNSASVGSIESSEKSNTLVNTSLATDVETVDADEDITVTFTNTSPQFDVTFAKSDQLEGLYISGASLQVLDSNGNEVASWQSEENEYTISLPAGDYVLHEVSAPEGYCLADDIKFSISESGVLTVGDKPGETVTVVKMIDTPKNLNVNMPASGSKEELWFMLFGCLLLTAGCIYIGRYYIKKRRRF